MLKSQPIANQALPQSDFRNLRSSFGVFRAAAFSTMLLVALTAVRTATAANLPEKVDYNYHIKPLLSDRCYACHGPDEKARKGKLRLDVKEQAFKALDDGWAVI